ncbi:hypothetical protein HGP17_04405 [Rhizobium sp. P38BS-XIX]|uniref:hypothetical protein n=1 Tax=Rhizobium sp. P38BS-XIX TaxID=2726740 RepID=UPI0014563AD6|nr:hypothetical protein [Rhizobium sp. P38BS-XIX]NLR96069.1 hypothetical protein [Rhizobium sp. P38BS-XIX]
MPVSKLQREVVLKALASVYQTVGDDGMRTSFMLNARRGNPFSGGISITLFFRHSLLVEAAVILRRDGPSFYRHISLSEVQSDLRNFVVDHFNLVGDAMILKQVEGSLLENAPKEKVEALAEALAQSSLFAPKMIPTIFPIIPVKVEDDFEGKVFCAVSPDGLARGTVLPEKFRPILVPNQFPPFAEKHSKKEIPNSWLVVRVPHAGTGSKLRSAILGAVALSVRAPYRYQFTGREMFGGKCALTDTGYTLNFSDPATPALGQDVILQKADHAWLRILDKKLESNADADVRQIKALQYYYRAWFLEDAERFPITCMALDSLLGDQGAATESVIKGVRDLLGEQVEWDRLSLLMKLRGSVIHGGAPDVYESSKYARYYSGYGEDPISDMDSVVTECLRRKIFGADFVEQVDPYAKIIEEHRNMGNIPASNERKGILG